MTASLPGGETLAAALAARLIHDFAGPLSGVATGLDLLADTVDPALKASAIDLAASSARSLLDLLDFCRVAFGAVGEAQGGQALERLASTPFAGRRARLVWSSSVASFDAVAAQAALILCQIAAEGLGAGGVARLDAHREGAALVLAIDAEATRATLAAEAIDGLAGRALTAGVAGRWGPARYLHAVVTAVGGTLVATTQAEGFRLRVTLPVRAAASP